MTIILRLFKSKSLRCAIALLLTLICYIILLSLDSPDYWFSVLGGVVGAISSLVVLVDNIVQKKDKNAPFSLLFWRAFCDLGLAIRFLAVPGFNLLICNNLVCTRATADEDLCSFPSAMFEFFSISSEAWFLCNGLDLYYSVTNPFSSLKSRMAMYHGFVWSVALMFSVLPLISRHKDRIYGFWYVNANIDQSAVCWIKVNENSLSMPIWVLFFIPLLVIYSVCSVSLVVAYVRLRRGITRTFLPRMKLLMTNTANVIVLILYWFVLVLFYSLAFFTRHYTYNKYLNDVLAFIFASKGFSALIVWLLVSDKNFSAGSGGSDGMEEDIDTNKALREEVLNFATAGIRASARAGDKVTKDRREITRLPQQATASGNKTLITPFFFLRFILGQHDEVRALENMISNKRRSVNASFRRQTIQTAPVADRAGQGEDDVEMATMRLSQRTTEVCSVNGSHTAGVPRGTVRVSEAEGEETERRYTSEMSARASEMVEAGASADVDDAYNEVGSTNICSRVAVSLKSCLLDSSEAVEFTEFEPYYFRQIRLSVGITDDIYINYFSTTIKERLTQGGASGAFFFFSKGEKFIAKSCTSSELDSLKNSAERYSNYLTNNKDSFISKIFGAYRLRIYGISLHFFVMNNIFLNAEGLLMNEKYDIKGSWVARNAEPPSNGQSVTCTHCEQKYVYYKKTKKTKKRVNSFTADTPSPGRAALDLNNGDHVVSFTSNPLKSVSDSGSASMDDDSTLNTLAELVESQHCPYTVNGRHEPNLILKDNDLKYKIRLPLPTAVHLLRQIQMDAEFLFSIGVCDYSLLVGVHNTEYEVQQEGGSLDGFSRNKLFVRKFSSNDELRLRNNTFTPFASTSVSDEQLRATQDSLSGAAAASSGDDGLQFGTARKLEVLRVVGPDAYFMGIIDYQQKWTFKKKLERFFKINFKGADPEGLSAIEPETYRDRFLRKIEEMLDFENLNRTMSLQSSVGSDRSSRNVSKEQ